MSLTLKQAAEYVGSSRQNVCNLVRRGSVRRNDDGTYEQVDLDFYLNHNPRHLAKVKKMVSAVETPEPVVE